MTQTTPSAPASLSTAAFFEGWIKNEAAAGDSINVKRMYIDLAGGSLVDGVMLSQIMYWHSPNPQTGKTRLRVEREGHLWLAKHNHEWWEECRIKERTARDSLGRLEQLGVIHKRLWHFNGKPTPHIRIDPARFQELIAAVFDGSIDDLREHILSDVKRQEDFTRQETSNTPDVKRQIAPASTRQETSSAYTETTKATETTEQNPLARAPEGAAPERADQAEPDPPTPESKFGLTVGQTVYWPQEAELGALDVHECAVLRFTAKKVWVRTAAGSEHCLSPRSLHAAPPKLERKTDPLQDVLAQRSFGLPPDATVGKQMMTVLNALKRDILASWPAMTPDELNRIYDEAGITPSNHASILGMINRHYAKKGEDRDRSTKQTKKQWPPAKPRGRTRTDAQRPRRVPALEWQTQRNERITRELQNRKPTPLPGSTSSDV